MILELNRPVGEHARLGLAPASGCFGYTKRDLALPRDASIDAALFARLYAEDWHGTAMEHIIAAPIKAA
jgi:hypothetical protein